MRAPDAAQRSCGALLIRGPWCRMQGMGPGSAEQREERCTASGTREYCFTSSQDEVQTLIVRSASSRVSNHETTEEAVTIRANWKTLWGAETALNCSVWCNPG